MSLFSILAKFTFLIFIFYATATTENFSWNTKSTQESDEQAEENQDPEAALDGTIQKMHQTFQKFFYNSPATDNQIVELIVGPTHFLPENYLSVKSSNGSSYKFDNVGDLGQILCSCQGAIPHTTFLGMAFNNDLLQMLISVDRALWTGMIQIVGCGFGRLPDSEIYDLFSHTLKPESLSLVDNVGLTSDLLNAGIHDHIFGDSLAINGDPQITGQLLLNPDVLVTFLHEPQSPPKHAILTVNPEYIDGGVQDLEAKTVERFKTNITHVSFHLRFTTAVKLSLSNSPLYDTYNNELLSQNVDELGPVPCGENF